MSRQELQAKWGSKPDFSAVRPVNGWESYSNSYLGKKADGFGNEIRESN